MQGWVLEVTDCPDQLMKMVRAARKERRATSIGFHGNAVTVWERFLQEYRETGELLVELGSDQTSCHNPYNGGYYPVQLTYDQAGSLLAKDRGCYSIYSRIIVMISDCLYLNLNVVSFLIGKYLLRFLCGDKRILLDLGS